MASQPPTSNWAGKPPATQLNEGKGGKGGDDDDDDDNDKENPNSRISQSKGNLGSDVPEAIWKINVGSLPALLPSVGFCLKSFLGATVALYILNQKHLLPKPFSRVVSKCLFWPTLPITVCRRIGSWETIIDETVVMGGAPFGFAKLPEKLYNDYGVRGVINMCEEYRGPVEKYDELGMTQLYLPTVDHFDPSVADLEEAIRFIEKYEKDGSKVYVHCRAGHGRSAAVVFSWLLSKDPSVDLKKLNQHLLSLRNVRKTLWKQQNIIRLHARLTGKAMDEEDVEDENEL